MDELEDVVLWDNKIIADDGLKKVLRRLRKEKP